MQVVLERAQKSVDPKGSRRPRWKRTRLQQRARLTLIAGMVLFALSQIVMRWFIDQHRPEWRDPSFEIKYRQLARLRASVERESSIVLFMGSSITGGGMKADMCEAPLSSVLQRPVIAYNFATPCGGPFTQLVYLQRLLHRGVRPDLVVFELSPLFLDCPDVPLDVPRFPGYILEHSDLATVSKYNEDGRLYEEWWEACLIPVYGHRLTILNHASKALVAFPDQMDLYADMTAHGWRKHDPGTHGACESPCLGSRYLWTTAGQAFYRTVLVNCIDQVLALLAREKIPTLLVRVLEGPLLRSLYSKKSVAAFQLAFVELSHRHQFPLIDSSDWFDEDHFIDSYHMTYVAAEKLTSRLMNERILPHFMSRLHRVNSD